ncbi:MAG: ABC transporter substrate-binding protein [Pseudomonadota bacterium]
MTDRLRAAASCLAAVWSLHALAATAAELPACPGPITVGLYDSGVLYDPASGRGIDHEVIEELAQRSHCRLVTTVYPRVRIWTMLESGQLDMTVSGIASPERERYSRFITYMTTKNMVILDKKKALALKDWKGFMADPSMSIGVVRSFRYSDFYDAQLALLKAQGRVGEVADLAQVIAQFKKQRWGAVLSHPLFYPRYFSSAELEDQYAVLDWAPGEAPIKAGLVMGRHRFNEAEVAKWQALIVQMKNDGSLRKIFAKYLPKNEIEHTLDF